MGHRKARVARSLLGVVAAIAMACGSPGPDPEPSAIATGSDPSPVESGPLASFPGIVLDPATIDEPEPHVYGGSQATAVVAFRGALLAFGNVNGGCCDGSFSTDTHAVVWSSPDGHQWTIGPTGPELSVGVMTAAAASSERVVVVGTRRLPTPGQDGVVNVRAAVWTSEDGESWELVTDVPAFTTVAATESGFVAASNAQAFPELWWSATGSTWQRIAGLADLGNGRIDRLVATSVGFVGVGSAINREAEEQPGNAVDAAAVWQSTDGDAWTRVAPPPSFARAAMHDVGWSEGRLLAAGTEFESMRPLFWMSTDGDTWDRIDSPAVPEATLHATHVIGMPHGFLVTGTWSSTVDESQFGLAAWTTNDGLAWRGSTASANAEINALALMPDGVVAAVGGGWREDIERHAPLGWRIAIPS